MIPAQPDLRPSLYRAAVGILYAHVVISQRKLEEFRRKLPKITLCMICVLLFLFFIDWIENIAASVWTSIGLIFGLIYILEVLHYVDLMSAHTLSEARTMIMYDHTHMLPNPIMRDLIQMKCVEAAGAGIPSVIVEAHDHNQALDYASKLRHRGFEVEVTGANMRVIWS